jgi:hypothetical protein
MDGTQQQIGSLNRKVDQLYEIVERMSHQIALLIAEKQQLEIVDRQRAYNEPEPLMIPESSVISSYSLGIMEHKDILQDNDHKSHLSNGGSDNSWSADIQIRRLTAQLTAAYNRIAALEEQLLSYRIH